MIDILNIDGLSTEEKIKKSIDEAQEELKDLTKERMCKAYSDVLYEKLQRHHVISKKMNTKEMGCNYEHHFILALNQEETYLVDLSFIQFISHDEMQELSEKGYQKLEESSWQDYIRIVTMEDYIPSLKQQITKSINKH